MKRHCGPLVRGDQVRLRAEAPASTCLRGQWAGLNGDARAGVALQDAAPHNRLEEDIGVEQADARLGCDSLEADELFEVHYKLEAAHQAEIENCGRRQHIGAVWLRQVLRGAELEL